MYNFLIYFIRPGWGFLTTKTGPVTGLSVTASLPNGGDDLNEFKYLAYLKPTNCVPNRCIQVQILPELHKYYDNSL